jgi:hypothetical protein
MEGTDTDEAPAGASFETTSTNCESLVTALLE